jgi:hypothetical protein
MSYYNKYLKYKLKYTLIKNKLGGSANDYASRYRDDISFNNRDVEVQDILNDDEYNTLVRAYDEAVFRNIDPNFQQYHQNISARNKIRKNKIVIGRNDWITIRNNIEISYGSDPSDSDIKNFFVHYLLNNPNLDLQNFDSTDHGDIFINTLAEYFYNFYSKYTIHDDPNDRTDTYPIKIENILTRDDYNRLNNLFTYRNGRKIMDVNFPKNLNIISDQFQMDNLNITLAAYNRNENGVKAAIRFYLQDGNIRYSFISGITIDIHDRIVSEIIDKLYTYLNSNNLIRYI